MSNDRNKALPPAPEALPKPSAFGTREQARSALKALQGCELTFLPTHEGPQLVVPIKITGERAGIHRCRVILTLEEWIDYFHDGAGERAFSLVR